MYSIPFIQELSDKLESGQITINECLSKLETVREERQMLRERCEALNTLAYINRAKKRSDSFDIDPARSDAFLEIKDAWSNCRPVTKENLIESIKYTKAFENGLIDSEKLEKLEPTADSFTKLMTNLKELVK